MKEDSIVIEIVTRAEEHYQHYIAAQAVDTEELNGLEIIIRKEKMLVLWISIVLNYAKTLTIKRVAGRDHMPTAFADVVAKCALHKMAANLNVITPGTLHTTNKKTTTIAYHKA